MQFPILLDFPDGSRQFFSHPVAWRDDVGTEHPPESLLYWTLDDWTLVCPQVVARTVMDPGPPEVAGKRAVRLPIEVWEPGADGATVTYELVNLGPAELVTELRTAQADAVLRVNREAGEARSRYITVAIGQEGTYLEKAREAQAFLADSDPDPANYPYLSAEAEATGRPIADIAALVAATAAAWTPVNARIEGLRQGALQTVKGADTPAAVAAVFPIDWPVPV